MKRYKFIKAGILIAAFLTAGCSNFSDINTNPDATTQVSASMLCTNIILRVTKFGGIDAKAMVSENALPKYVGYANEGQMDAQYNKITNGSFGSYTILPNIDKMVEYAKGSVMEDSYKGVAAFAKAWIYFRMTMEMGDVPMSEANQGANGNYKPKYDAQEDVLKEVIEQLKLADQYFTIGRTFTGDPTPYNGDPVKWRKAANAFALKVLMSLSKKTSSTKLNVVQRFAEIVQQGALLESATGYFGLAYTSTNKHPLSGTNDLFTSRTVVSSLLIDNLKLLNDRRMFYFAEPAASKISQGLTANNPDAYVGVDVSMDYATMNAGHSANLYSLINYRYLQQDASEPRRLMTYAEQQLILAEARILGWITSGSAQNYYESGVRAALADAMTNTASYAHGMAINQSYIDSYFTAQAAFKTNTSDQLRQVWMQRYILNFLQDAEYSYFEYRRNSYPVFPINPSTSLNTNNLNGIPMRWLYPSSEATYNRESLDEALQRQYEGYDEINKLMWLLK